MNFIYKAHLKQCPLSKVLYNIYIYIYIEGVVLKFYLALKDRESEEEFFQEELLWDLIGSAIKNWPLQC